MEKRFVVFIVLSFAILMGNMMLMRWMQPPKVAKQEAPAAGEKDKDAAAPNGELKAADKPADDKPADDKIAGEKAAADKPDAGKPDAEKPADDKPAAEKPAADQPAPANPPVADVPAEIYTLGSADPDSGFRLLATIVNTRAAVKRVEFNSPKYLDQEHRSGYIGHLDLSPPPKEILGATVRVVGPGTPAAAAGLKPGDLITEFDGEAVDDELAFSELLEKKSSDAAFSLTILRDGQPMQIEGQFRRIPMQVIRPEGLDPLSFLTTLQSVDAEKLKDDQEELPGVNMRNGNWQVVTGYDEQHLSFQYDLPDYGLQVFKHYTLEKVNVADADDPSARAYDLQLKLEIRNTGDKDRTVAWRQDGPTGLPLESTGYKISPNWFKSVGIRDVAVGFLRGGRTTYGLVSASQIAEDAKQPTIWTGEPLQFIAVDSQYFAVAMMPHKDPADAIVYSEAVPLRVGAVPADRANLNRTNVTFRVIGKPIEIAASGKPAEQLFDVFAGPKRPALLREYGLANLLHYGWFGWVAEPMLVILHLFYRIIPNYGIAIILLTVLVRSAMFPLSRRQAANAAKMQELQPEIKRLQEKYKGNMEARTKAQQELFRKHNYNPLAGCLPVFLQLPIFIGLYRSLSLDVELRGAPLISQSVRWCSNLAAPDMLFKWQEYLPAVLGGPNGFLGPWFNVLPCITIALFIWQQKMFMPPATDEQTAMQQKMMKYMMVVVGVMFFKVPSGLCLYFISSSLWGITERKLLPKAKPVAGSGSGGGSGGTTIDVRPIVPRSGGNGSGGSKKKTRGRA